MKNTIRDIILAKPAPLYSTDGVPEDDKRVLFTLAHRSGWMWTAYEADEVEMDDILCFGRVNGFESELGYFSVDEALQAGAVLLRE